MDAVPLTSPARTIPLIEVDSAGAVALLEAAPERLADIMATAQARYTPIGLRLGDTFSRRWLARAGNPYLEEISAIAAKVGHPGVFFLNLSYEWTCTSSVGVTT